MVPTLKGPTAKGDEVGFHFLILIMIIIVALWVIKGLDFCSNIDTNFSLSLFLPSIVPSSDFPTLPLPLVTLIGFLFLN